VSTSPETTLNDLLGHVRRTIAEEMYARVAPIPMLAHYTSLDALRSILRSKELWFSRIRDTNDTSEAVEGAAIVAAALEEHGQNIFKQYADFGALEQFEARRTMLETDTFVLSLCEHGSDRQTDRLVMWQAYGFNGNGLCLVLRKDSLLGQKAKGLFPVHWCPIEYEAPEELGDRVRRRLNQVKQAFNAAPQPIATLPKRVLGAVVASSVASLVFGHKNPAFEHEREVRFVRSRLLQTLAPPDGAGYRRITTQGKIKDIFVLPLRYYPEFPIDAALPNLLDHVIVGPL